MLIYPPTTDWSSTHTPDELEKLDTRKRAYAEALSWYTLSSLTGWRLGVAPTTVRPCAQRCAPFGSYIAAPVGSSSGQHGFPAMSIGGPFQPHLSGGVWTNSCGCGGRRDCSCSNLSEVILPGPVGDIVEVKINGVVIPRAEYRIDNGNRLVSLTDRAWPICQDMAASVDDEGSFAVTYYRGAAPNEMANMAAGILAAEFYKASNGQKCRLPKGVTNVVRRGVTFDVPQGTFMNGDTGIPEVNAFIQIYNPHKLKGAPRVLSPEMRTARRTTVS